MKTLSIDIETYSSADLGDCGVYRYVEAPDFEILLFAYAFDDEPVVVIDLTASGDLPDVVRSALTDPNITKTAWNANFERVCIERFFGIPCDPRQWRCSMVWAMALGLPGSLEKVAEVMKIEAQKDRRGKALIKKFSVPKIDKNTNKLTRTLPGNAPEEWQAFIEYCRRDVEAEREIRKRLERFPLPDHEWELWAIDQRINDRGVQLDRTLFERAIACHEQYKNRLLQEARDLTGLENPNSVAQLKTWLEEQGIDVSEGLRKEKLPELLQQADEETRQVLEIRSALAKSSVSKYQAMAACACSDDRARGLLQFCGAGRTWRWAGRLIQVQNLPHNKLADLELARQLLRDGRFEELELLFGAPPYVLSELIRTTFVPAPGRKLIVADFSSIEARIVAWLADEKWVLGVFRDHGKIYEATAAMMFGVPMETIVKGHPNYELRARGKIAVLACGYGGGPAVIQKMDVKKEISPDDYPRIVQKWREANPNIVRLWGETQRAAIEAVRRKATVRLKHGVQYRFRAGILFADLPSGRSLAYQSPRIEMDPETGRDILVYKAAKQKHWVDVRAWGGLLVENLVQAIARDCLAEALRRLDADGVPVVMHVHDEIVAEVEPSVTVESITRRMIEPMPWAPDLPLDAAGFETEFYRKD